MNDMTTFAGHIAPASACPTCGRHYGNGPLTIDFGSGKISQGGRSISAPRRELLLAAALNDAFPKWLTHEEARCAMWHEDECEIASDNGLYTHTSKLRSRLRKAGFQITIVHPRGQGLAFKALDKPGVHSKSPTKFEQPSAQLVDA